MTRRDRRPGGPVQPVGPAGPGGRGTGRPGPVPRPGPGTPGARRPPAARPDGPGARGGSGEPRARSVYRPGFSDDGAAAPRRPDHRDPTRTTGPNPRLPQDARAPRDRRTGPIPPASRAAWAPPGRPPRPPRWLSARRQPPRRPPRKPGRFSIRRGEPGRRVGVALLAIAIVLTLFAGRLVQIQGMESGYYRMAANKEKLTTIALPALRGTIYGANGQILAMTIETFTYTADPTQIRAADKPKVAQELAGPLGLTAASILNLLQHPTSPKYVVLAKGVSVAGEATITALGIVGVYASPVYSRAYPDGAATANVVGFTNSNQSTGVLAGQAGIEEEYNKRLTGTAGSEQVEIGADGQPIPLAGSQDTPARNGESIRLTIDPDLQFSAMQACRQEVRKAKAKQCTAVIIQPATGDILAMAQWPSYDQNTLANVADAANLDVQDVFTPGSTAKVITAAAALEHGGKTTMSAYNIPYVIYRGGQSIHDAEWSPGERYTIAGIVANSSNVGMSQVVQSVAPRLQYDYLRSFGLDRPTGLGLPGESEGLLPPPSQWAADERYTLAYGQGIAVNAVQMAGVYATIANGGVRVRPRLIAGTYDAAGRYTPAPASKSTRVIAAKTAAELIPILQQVPAVDQAANQPWGIIPGYAVAAKTGTANEPGPKCPSADPLCVYGASYIGMAPGNGPKVVVAINVQNPDRASQNYFGDEVAGPVFYSVMKNALSALQIQPQPGLEPPYVRLNAR